MPKQATEKCGVKICTRKAEIQVAADKNVLVERVLFLCEPCADAIFEDERPQVRKKMKARVTVKQEVDVKTIKVFAKVRDCAGYEVVDSNWNKIAAVDDSYVPEFFPGQHYGDYLYLDIDVETGQITNWKKPTAKQLEDFIAKCNGEGEEE